MAKLLHTAAGLAALILMTAGASFAQDAPRAVDGTLYGAVYNGEQTMPVTLYGVSRDWDVNCGKGRVRDCLRLAEAFETGLGDLEPSIRVAAGYYSQACEAGDGAGCAQYSAIVIGGTPTFSNYTLAREKALYGCDTLNAAIPAPGWRLQRIRVWVVHAISRWPSRAGSAPAKPGRTMAARCWPIITGKSAATRKPLTPALWRSSWMAVSRTTGLGPVRA